MTSILVVRTAPVPGGRRAADLTARAQIRDAAIESFAASGFRASFRDIATRAGVSPALITHHFGSKDALRRECDDEVLRRYASVKTGAIPDIPEGAAERLRDITHDEAVLTVYVMRAVSSGGRSAQLFLDRLTDQVRDVLTAYEEAGLIRPSRDPEARVRYFAQSAMGAVLMQFLTQTWTTPEEFTRGLLARDGDFVLPMLELYTEGLLSSPDMLEHFLADTGDPSDAPSQSGTPSDPPAG